MAEEVIKELLKNEKFSTTSEVMEAIKDMFKDVLQEVMEAELDIEPQIINKYSRNADGSFREAIGAVYPKAGIPRCIIHQIIVTSI